MSQQGNSETHGHVHPAVSIKVPKISSGRTCGNYRVNHFFPVRLEARDRPRIGKMTAVELSIGLGPRRLGKKTRDESTAGPPFLRRPTALFRPVDPPVKP